MDSESAKTRFLTAIGHDMRQPLHALLLYLSALDRRVTDDDARAVLGKADQAAQSLASMIEGLIQLARLDAGKVEAEAERLSLQNLFDELIAASPHTTADPTTLYVHSDPALLQIIVQQLLSNAAKHGGGKAHLSAVEENGAVEIRVRDKGPGIDANDHKRIFGEFVRLDGAAATGLGIGLTIAEQLASLLNHQIEIRSTPGEGATFIVRAARA
jgi:signal transduction histidine kinase